MLEKKKDGSLQTFKFSTDDQNIFFTSDTHFGHANIMEFCGRPFANVAEMNQTMIERWNAKVGENDYVFHLGDFAFGNSAVWCDTLAQLKGHKVLIEGNHDRKNLRESYRKHFELVTTQMMIYVNNQAIYLNHLPFLCYDGVYRSRKDLVWQLFGHVHISTFKNTGKDFERIVNNCMPTQYDVGVDLNNFEPISFEEVTKRINFQIDNKVNVAYWIDHNI